MYKSIDINKIKIINKKNEIIFSNLDGSPILFQGSKGFLNKKITNETQYVWIHYLNETPRKKIMFKNLENLKIKLENNMDNKIHPFYHQNGIGSFTQHYNNKIILDIYINQDNILQKLDDFPEKCYCYPLIWFSGLKKKDDRWYLTSKLIQLMIFPIYLKFNICLIDTFEEKKETIKVIDTIDTTDKIRYIDHPLYGKYFKMLNIGIPKMAIIIKIKNELGDDFINIMDNNSNEYIDIQKIKMCDHPYYSKFFKMQKMGVPRMAIEQKLNIENVNINILDKPDEIIFNIPIIKNNMNTLIEKKKLKSITIKIEQKNDNNKKVIDKHPQIDLNELMNKRMLMLNKKI
jgi:hypothetical protein